VNEPAVWPLPPPTDPDAVARIDQVLADVRARLYAEWWRRTDGTLSPEIRIEHGIVRRWETKLSDRSQPLTRTG
jgi:hypothetical protein